MKKLFWIALFLAAPLNAAVRTETVAYKHGKAALEGVLAYDDALTGPRPGVLVVHEWTGLGPNAQRRAEQLAALGYTAFAVDMYGKGVRAKNHEEAAKLSGIYRNDRTLMRARIAAGLDVLKKNPRVDAQKTAAIGYCFGGTTVLELARSGADVAGVASFHGGLDTPNPELTQNVKAKVLVLHGAEDAWTREKVPAFEDEMRKAKADWQLITYGNAVHSFTVKEAGDDPTKGMAYDEKADRRSWEALKGFLKEIFGE